MTEESHEGQPEIRQLGTLTFEPTACPICGHTETRRPLRKQFQGNTLHFGTCTCCDTLYMNSRLEVDSLRKALTPLTGT